MEPKFSLNILQKLVEIPSVSTDKSACLTALELIKSTFLDHNIPCVINFRNGTPFLVAGHQPQATILFLSHIDVVPAKNDQFQLKVENGQIIGRGVLDMKGPLIASFDAFIRLWRQGNRNLLFVVTSDEEIGGFNGTSELIDTVFGGIKTALVVDSTGEELVLRQKAPFHIKISASGKSIHASKPWLGINAARSISECCLKIITTIDKNTPDNTTAVLTQIHSGQSNNTVPDSATAVLDLRILKCSEVSSIVKQLNHITKEFNCHWQRIDKPLFFEISERHKVVKKWQGAFIKVHHHLPATKIECGASDARFLWNNLHIPIIITSVKGGGAHSENEWAEIKSLENLSKTIFSFIQLL